MEYFFCPYCGTKNTYNAKFCNECGKNLSVLQDIEKVEPMPDPDVNEQIGITKYIIEGNRKYNEIVHDEELAKTKKMETDAPFNFLSSDMVAVEKPKISKSSFSMGRLIAIVSAALLLIGVIVVIARMPHRRQLNADYQQAIENYDNKEYLDASEFFMNHQDYKQSKKYYADCRKHFAKDIDPTIDNLKMISEALGDYNSDEDGGTVYVSDELDKKTSSFKMVGLNGSIYFTPVDYENSNAEICCIWQANYYLDDEAQENCLRLLTITLGEDPQIVSDDEDTIYVWEDEETNLQIMLCPSSSEDLSIIFFDLDHKMDLSGLYEEDEIIEPSKSSSSEKANTNSSASSSSGAGITASHTCEECSKPGVCSIQGISGQTEYYCAEHYAKLKELQDYLYGDN